MADVSPRRLNAKRITLWASAVVLFVVGYVAGAPFVAILAVRYLPQSKPLISIVYAPLAYVEKDPTAPGHAALKAYLEWSEKFLDRLL
jgi:hypothetical protein